MVDLSLFSVPALFIVFRETLEAAIIVSVLLGVLLKLKLTHLNRFVWIGVGAGFVFTILVLIAFVIAFNAATDNLIEGADDGANSTSGGSRFSEGEIKLKAGLTFSAAIIIAVVCWTLGGILKHQEKIEKEITDELQEAVRESEEEHTALSGRSLFFLSFTSVAREGVETVVFLGVGSSFELKSLPIPIVAGFVAGSLAGVLMFKAGSKLALIWFFRISVVFLQFVGAGVFAHGIEELYHLHDFGWWGELVYNISLCCGLRKPQWQLARAVIGYSPYPTRAEVFGYFMYHLMIITGFIVKWRLEKLDINPEEWVKAKINKLLGKEAKEKKSLENGGEDESDDMEAKAPPAKSDLKETSGEDLDTPKF